MEEVIRRVASIDKKASEILKETEEYLASKEKDIKEKIETMRFEVMSRTKSEVKVLYDAAVEEAEAEGAKIRNNAKEESNRITSKFMKIKEVLETQLFSRIFS